MSSIHQSSTNESAPTACTQDAGTGIWIIEVGGGRGERQHWWMFVHIWAREKEIEREREEREGVGNGGGAGCQVYRPLALELEGGAACGCSRS